MSPAPHGLLRWYPPEWRRRYGDEFAALIDDTIGDDAPSVRLRLHVMRAGTAMRLREAGLAGDETPPSEWMRGGALAVLCAWSIFVVAGIALQKTAEHWQDAVPAGPARTWAAIAFGTVQATAAIASLLIVAGAVAVLPAVARFLAGGGRHAVRRPLAWAAALGAVTLVALGGVVWWAHGLTVAQRNGGDVSYALGALALALLTASSIAAITNAAVAIVRRLALSPTVLRFLARLSAAVAVAIVVMTIATGAWGALVATPALQEVAIATLMLTAVIVAGLGARRAVQGTRRLG